MRPPLIIGIVGGSGSGKSWLAHRICAHFQDAATAVEQDWYYRDLSGLDPELAAQTNFDHPDAIESELLLEHLRLLAVGRPIDAPSYAFSTFSRAPQRRRIEPKPLIVLEGLFVLHWPEIAALCACSVFVHTPSDLRLARRIRRDLAERGYTLDRILDFWESRARPMYSRFVAPQRRRATHLWRSEQDKAFVPAFLADLDHRLAENADEPTA